MKKTIVLLLIGCTMLLGACGGNAGSAAGAQAVTAETSASEGQPAKDSSTDDATGENAEENTTEEAMVSADETEESAGDFVPLGPFKKEATIEETILYDQHDVKITAIALAYENYSASLELLMENNSDKNLEFTAQSVGYSCNAINDAMIKDGYVRSEIPAGESATEYMDFGYEDMLIYGVSEIGTIQTGFSISDEEYNRFYTGPIIVETSAAGTVESGAEAFHKAMQSKALQYTYGLKLLHFSEEEVYSSAGISIASETYMQNEDGEHLLMLEVKNDTEEITHVSFKDIKVNGTLVYEGTWTGETVTSGKRAIADISPEDIVDEEEWAEYGIEEIESISFTVNTQNADGMVMAEPAEVTVEL